MNKKITLRSIITVVVIMSMVMISTVSSFAVSVDLHSNQTSASSSSFAAKQARVTGGSNSSNSAHGVYYIAQYQSSGSWVEDAKKLVDPGKSVSAFNSFSFSSNHSWRLQLNPWGALFSGCTASGTIAKNA